MKSYPYAGATGNNWEAPSREAKQRGTRSGNPRRGYFIIRRKNKKKKSVKGREGREKKGKEKEEEEEEEEEKLRQRNWDRQGKESRGGTERQQR